LGNRATCRQPHAEYVSLKKLAYTSFTDPKRSIFWGQNRKNGLPKHALPDNHRKRTCSHNALSWKKYYLLAILKENGHIQVDRFAEALFCWSIFLQDACLTAR